MAVNNTAQNDDLVQVPREEEIRQSIAQLQNNKAPEEDEITEEMLAGEPIVQWLTQLSHAEYMRL